MEPKLTFKQSMLAGLMAASAAVLVNSVLFLIFHALGVINDSVFVQPNQPLTIIPVVFSSILPTLIGALVFFLFEKYTNNGFKLFRIVAIILVALSLISPFVTVQGMPLGFGIVLDLMHLAVAFLLLYFIKRASIKK